MPAANLAIIDPRIAQHDIWHSHRPLFGSAGLRCRRAFRRGEPLALETTAHFDPKRGVRSVSEDPAQAEFWPVPVDDLMPQIGDVVRQIRSA